eukprot:gene16355-25071_t
MKSIRAQSTGGAVQRVRRRRYATQNTNFEFNPYVPAADEDNDFLHTPTNPHMYKVMTTVPRESSSVGTHARARTQWRTPVINHNQAHLQEQFAKTNPAFNHVQVLDTPCDDGVAGLWSYPFFFTQEEQTALQGEAAPLFRNEEHSVRVKNTYTHMRNTFASEAGGKVRNVRHGWAERNHPLISRVGRRNAVSLAAPAALQSLPPTVRGKAVPLDPATAPSTHAALQKVWEYFGGRPVSATAEAGSSGAKKRKNRNAPVQEWHPPLDRPPNFARWNERLEPTSGMNASPATTNAPVQEWHPSLDRPPNFARWNEWLEPTSGMNAHVKAREFGNYVGIVNLHAPVVLQLCHAEEGVEERYDEETPDGLAPATKLLLLPGSLTFLKYDARWRIPYGYSYEPQHAFRLKSMLLARPAE